MINDPDFDLSDQLVPEWNNNKKWKEMLLHKVDLYNMNFLMKFIRKFILLFIIFREKEVF